MFFLPRMTFAAALALTALVPGSTAAAAPAAAPSATLTLAASPLPVDWSAGALPVRLSAHFVVPALPAAAMRAAPKAERLRRLSPDDITTSAIAPAIVRPAVPRAPQGMFGSVELPFGKLPVAARLRELRGELAGRIACNSERCSARARMVEDFVGQARGRLDLISRVNRAVNGLVAYRSDRDGYGKLDYWAGPVGTLTQGFGDCEDYAMLKMAFLAANGVDPRQMSVVVLRDRSRQAYHSVLVVRHGEQNLVLDNLERDVRRDSELAHYQPLYSITGGKGFIHGWRTGGAPAMASVGRLASIAPGEGFDAPQDTAPLPAAAW